MAEITIKWDKQYGRPYGNSYWDGITDPAAEIVCDLLDAVEDADGVLDRQEVETLLQAVDRAILDITLAVRAAEVARKKK